MSLSNYPTIRPSLVLDFQKAEVVDPRITFTRASTATRFNSYGVLETVANDIPRIDFNPTTLVCNGLLVEESRTNLLVQSEDFSTTWAVSNSSIITNATTAPDGTATADKLVDNAVLAGHFVGQSATTATTTHVFSVYVKRAERNWCVVYASGANVGSFFDLVNGVVGSAFIAAPTSTSIQSIGNGWFRCSITFTATSSTTVRVYTATADGLASYTGDGTSGIFIWGAQLEAGAFATSYIPTVAATVTRQADVASMTGTNFSSWYNASEGTLFANWTSFIPNGTSPGSTYPAGFTDNFASTGSAQLVIQNRAVSNQIRVWQSTTGGGLDDFITLTTTTFQGKTAAVYGGAANVTASANGGAAVTMTNPIQTTIFNALTIGSASGTTTTSGILNGHLQRISYYPARLTNAQLQALTAT